MPRELCAPSTDTIVVLHNSLLVLHWSKMEFFDSSFERATPTLSPNGIISDQFSNAPRKWPGSTRPHRITAKIPFAASCCPFDTVENCSREGRADQSVVSDLDGTLLRSSSSFPYFLLVAFEAGSPLRALVLLLLSPVIWFSYHLVSEAAGIKLLIFISFAGLKLSAIQSVARGVLPKFYLEDMHPHTYKIFTACKERYVVTANPRVMVEPFLKEFLNTTAVLGTEIQVTSGGYATGFVKSAPEGLGVLVGSAKATAVKQHFNPDSLPHLALGDRRTDFPFMALCKESYVVPRGRAVPAVSRDEYLKPLIFHEGRLVQRPTPLNALTVLLWLPFGVFLCFLRAVALCLVPTPMLLPALALLGCRIRIKGTPPPQGTGVMFVSTHRTLFDPVFIKLVTRRKNVSTVVYSLSGLSELLSPMKTVRLSRNRDKDSSIIDTLLQGGDLVICPEGTTCREPYLLRFSSLFAELSDRIVPVATRCGMSLFHGTTASGGKSNHEVGNHVQKLLADCLGFQCTNLTRQHKYQVLAGNDGLVAKS